MTTPVQYYEFNDAPYYALIMATNTYEALKTYEAVVAEINPAEEVLPVNLTEGQAALKLSQTPSEEGKPGKMGVPDAKQLIEDYKITIDTKLEYNSGPFGELLAIDAGLL